MFFNIYGTHPAGERLKRILSSPNYKNGSFQNESKTNMMAEDSSMLGVMTQFFSKPAGVSPRGELPSVKTDLKNFKSDLPALVWFGHSSYLIYVNGKKVLVDPVFSGNASPFSFMIKAFPGTNNYSAEDLPVIDVLLITHDHYDHLDYHLVSDIRNKVKSVVCPLGVGAHLEAWGYDPMMIKELDWHEQVLTADLKFTACPARHFSGRGLKRGQTLWSAFILETREHKFYLGGDSGYDHHFKAAGENHGPFDLAVLEAGQYNVSWPNIHMMPEETVKAAKDLKARLLLPVHWGKFALALHKWDEPVRRLVKKAGEMDVKTATPRIGEPLIIGADVPVSTWWDLR